jgi:hypothetical protein
MKVGVGREDAYFCLRGVFFYLFASFNAGHARHNDIHKNKMYRIEAADGNRFSAICCFPDNLKVFKA